MNIVLVEPEIPANTGNIARTCAVTGAHLHLVEPLGFSTADKYLKRAGLDYWHLVQMNYYRNFAHCKESHPQGRFFYMTKKAQKRYDQVQYQAGDFLVFGKETQGLPEDILAANPEHCLRVPMILGARSLNLANSVAVVLYEALRQQNFPHLT